LKTRLRRYVVSCVLSERGQLDRIASAGAAADDRRGRGRGLGTAKKRALVDHSQQQAVGFDLRHQKTAGELVQSERDDVRQSDGQSRFLFQSTCLPTRA